MEQHFDCLNRFWYDQMILMNWNSNLFNTNLYRTYFIIFTICNRLIITSFGCLVLFFNWGFTIFCFEFFSLLFCYSSFLNSLLTFLLTIIRFFFFFWFSIWLFFINLQILFNFFICCNCLNWFLSFFITFSRVVLFSCIIFRWIIFFEGFKDIWTCT